MSEIVNTSRGGEFATSPRGKVAENYDFIRARAAAGVPVQHIARMVGCAVVDVQNVVGIPALEAAARPSPVSDRSRLAAIKVKPGRKSLPRAVQWKEVRDVRSKPMPPRVRRIVQEIADRRGFLLEDLIGPRVLKGLTLARNEAYHALYMTGAYSMTQIGGYIGGRDHTSVHHGIRNHGESSQAAADLAAWKAFGRREAA